MEYVQPLTLDSLVTLRSDVEPYVLEWPSGDHGESVEALVLVAMTRPGGFLGVAPIGLVPEEVLAVGNSPSPPGPVGPSTVFVVPSHVLDNGVLAPSGSEVAVLVVDFAESVLSQMHVPPPFSQLQFTFDQEQPFAVPAPAELVAKIQAWLEAGGDSAALGYVTANGKDGIDGQPLSDGDLPVDHASDLDLNAGPPIRPQRTKKPNAKPAVHGPGRPTLGEKRPTVASLAGSLQELIQVNAGLSQQVQSLALRQQQLEKRSQDQSLVPAPPQKMLSQPISSALATQSLQSAGVAKAIGTPPRTAVPTDPGLLRSLWIQPLEISELEEEKLGPPQSASHDHLAQAVLAQSKALTALVSQIASQSSDPMLELGATTFGAGTRGAQGRAKLQAELAQHKGSFFNAVLAAMARRMQPTSPSDGSPEDLMARRVSGTKYIERFGGYGKSRELGCLQYQVMQLLDFLQVGNVAAARDSAALLAVCLDQAMLDQGKFDLALLLTLQEDPPSSIFTHRQTSTLSKARAFSPLAAQQWVTVALAYVKELDLISAKRLEMTAAPKSNPFATPQNLGDAPKAKATPKKKGKGSAKGAPAAAADVEE